MKLIFNGILEQRNGGCKPCGHKSNSKLIMGTSKMFILPSGVSKTFFVGRESEVSDSDGAFLLTFTYTDEHGKEQRAFTEVE